MIPMYVIFIYQREIVIWFWPVAIACGSILLVIWMGLEKMFAKLLSDTPEFRELLSQYEQREEETNRLSDEEVISKCDDLIFTNSLYDIETSNLPLGHDSSKLPRLAKRFFEKYSHLRMETAGYTISKNLIRDSSLDSRFTRIGIYRVDNREIVVNGLDDAIYVLDEVLETRQPIESIAKSVFHFIILKNRDLPESGLTN